MFGIRMIVPSTCLFLTLILSACGQRPNPSAEVHQAAREAFEGIASRELTSGTPKHILFQSELQKVVTIAQNLSLFGLAGPGAQRTVMQGCVPEPTFGFNEIRITVKHTPICEVDGYISIALKPAHIRIDFDVYNLNIIEKVRLVGDFQIDEAGDGAIIDFRFLDGVANLHAMPGLPFQATGFNGLSHLEIFDQGKDTRLDTRINVLDMQNGNGVSVIGQFYKEDGEEAQRRLDGCWLFDANVSDAESGYTMDCRSLLKPNESPEENDSQNDNSEDPLLP